MKDKNREALHRELTQLLNRYCFDLAAKVPDFILAEFLLSSLDAFQYGVSEQNDWFGFDSSIGGCDDY